MGPKSNDWCSYEKADTQGEENHVKMEVETGIVSKPFQSMAFLN